MTFDEFVARCTDGKVPYDYQRQIAEHGLPELLTVPTGAGKTMAVVLGWLYRRRFHPDLEVRTKTPHWLVVCQPMRTLVEQVAREAHLWLAAAGLDANDDTGVKVHVFMGGEPTKRAEWRGTAHRDAIVIGTQDMLLSRALNRGFGSSRYLWPVEFGMLNSGTHWVFDEIQLMGAGVPTGRQLEAFRSRFDALLPHGSTWMSATTDEDSLSTVDNREIVTRITLSEADRKGPLAVRLNGPKRVTELTLPTDAKQRSKALSTEVIAKHRPGTLTIAVVNNVATAQDLHTNLRAAKPDAELLLLHSRFRRVDRKRLVDQLMSPIDAHSPGRIVVSTQVIEAGVDIDAASLFTEAAPWASVVQRLGRCNRAGQTPDATATWFAPAKPDKPLPYERDDVDAAMTMLRTLEGEMVVPDGLAERGPKPLPKLHPVLRAKDLLALFDTMPEIGGADIDVSPYVRDLEDDATVHIAWRNFGSEQDLRSLEKPTQAELCPAPLSKGLDDWVGRASVYRWDVIDRVWVRLFGRPRPNQILLADNKAGGYTIERGWDSASKVVVPPLVDDDTELDPQGELFEATDDDSASFKQHMWVSLSTHLLDTEAAAVTLCEQFGVAGNERAAVVASARRHDIGKAHEVFQDTMSSANKSEKDVTLYTPLAKSPGHERHRIKNFRHELASALALLGDAEGDLAATPDEDRFLVVYLTAAHHGRIRMSLRAMPNDEPERVFGIRDGDVLPAVSIGDRVVPAATLYPGRYTGLGLSTDGVRPWRERTEDLLAQRGPFTLALLESLVRLADWKASSAPSEGLLDA